MVLLSCLVCSFKRQQWTKRNTTVKRFLFYYNQCRLRPVPSSVMESSDNIQPLEGGRRGWCVDHPELVSAVTNVLQAQRRLSSLMRYKLHNNPAAVNAINESHSIQLSLRHLKSIFDGTQYNNTPLLSLKERPQLLSQLSSLVTAHTPDHMTQAIKTEISEKLRLLFEGQVKRILYACILSCPWYRAVSTDHTPHGELPNTSQRGTRGGRSNILYVVYVSSDEEFFSLGNNKKEQFDTLNEPPVVATEVRQFCHQLMSCDVKAVEVFCTPPEAVIFSSPDWDRLSSLVDPVSLLSRRFVDQCIGQAIRPLVKRRSDEQQTGLELNRYCDSFRLLSYAQSAINRQPISSWFEVDRNGEEEKLIIKSLKDVCHQTSVGKDELIRHVVSVKERVEEKVNEVPRSRPRWNTDMRKWLSNIRKEGVKFTQPSPISVSDPYRKFLDSRGLTRVHSNDIIVIAKAGSHMYNLATPTSDVDYIIIYRTPTQNILESLNLKESVIKRGGGTETTAYECRLFCEMLLKGSIVIFELLFANDLYYASDYWSLLTNERNRFLSEHVVSQYSGFIKHHLKKIESQSQVGTPSERKLFYQIFHKLLSLESCVQGGPPIVLCDGVDRDNIIKIRNGPFEDDFNREQLLFEAKTRFLHAREQLRSKTELFPEYGDHHTLQSWLLVVRGVQLNGVSETLF